MLLSHDKKFIYLKTLKTAGTSIEALFQPFCLPPQADGVVTHHVDETVTDHGIVGSRGYGTYTRFWNHMPAVDVRQLVGEATWDGYLKFCAVRDPFDKLVSWFWHRHMDVAAALEGAPFAEVRQAFIRFAADPANHVHDRHIYTLDGRICVDRMIRFEQLARDLAAVAGELGIDVATLPLPRFKTELRRRPEAFGLYYDAPTAALVADAYGFEIEMLGYARLEPA